MFCADYKSTNIIIAERSLTLDGVDDQSNNIKLNLHINEVNIATTKFFNIQSMDVAFSNGEKRQYERLKPDGDGAVIWLFCQECLLHVQFSHLQ
jgi:hypothetical protein